MNYILLFNIAFNQLNYLTKYLLIYVLVLLPVTDVFATQNAQIAGNTDTCQIFYKKYCKLISSDTTNVKITKINDSVYYYNEFKCILKSSFSTQRYFFYYKKRSIAVIVYNRFDGELIPTFLEVRDKKRRIIARALGIFF